MTSLAQLEANRANALRSTGPRTPEGKARSSLNASRHGLTGRLLVGLQHGPFADCGDEVASFVTAILTELDPRTELERAEALHIAGCLVRRQRLVELEAAALAHGTNVPVLPPAEPGGPTRVLERDLQRAGAEAMSAPLYERLPRYEGHLSREIERGLVRLRALQRERRDRETSLVGEVVAEATHLLRPEHGV